MTSDDFHMYFSQSIHYNNRIDEFVLIDRCDENVVEFTDEEGGTNLGSIDDFDDFVPIDMLRSELCWLPISFYKRGIVKDNIVSKDVSIDNYISLLKYLNGGCDEAR